MKRERRKREVDVFIFFYRRLKQDFVFGSSKKVKQREDGQQKASRFSFGSRVRAFAGSNIAEE